LHDAALGWARQDTVLLAFAATAMIGIVVLIAVAKVHPFLALTLASGGLGLAAGLPHRTVLTAFEKGVGDTLGGVGLVIALGTMLGKLLATSGGADRIVSSLVDRAGRRSLPWAIALGATLIGIPLFFEVSVVLMMPVIQRLARRTGGSTLRTAIPALAGLSVAHGLIPPHPAPLVATRLLHADVGRTLAYGLLVAVPTVAVAGPLFGAWIARRIDLRPPDEPVDRLVTSSPPPPLATAGPSAPSALHPSATGGPPGRVPSLPITLVTLLLPVALMLVRAGADVAGATDPWRDVADFVGDPVVALLISVLLAMVTFGYGLGLGVGRVGALLHDSLAPVAGLVLIIGAGGGFKETLIQSGIGASIGKLAQNATVPPLVLAWLIAVGVRVATGSATVATVTASGIVAPLVPTLHHVNPALLALSIGAGSLFFSHVNDAGFWLIKEYLGMTVGQTLRSWSAMETLISVVGLLSILALAAIP
jgi:GntP family gluconate:H+ symporter